VCSSDLYAPQLEAYAYALENPDKGKPFPVSSMGLLIWKLAGVTETSISELASHSHGFGVNQHYVPVERDTEKFSALLEELISTIEGGMPDSGAECNVCNYLSKRAELQID
jgi:hypothetical protein